MHRVILPVCLLVLIAVTGCPSTPKTLEVIVQPPPTVTHKPMAELLPAGVLLMIESAGRDNAADALAATDVGKILAEPVVDQYLKGPGRQLWNALLDLLAKQQGPAARQTVEDVLTVLTRRPWALAVTDLSLAKKDMGGGPRVVPEKAAAVLLCRPGGNKAWDRLADMMTKLLAAQAPNQRKITLEGAELTFMHGPVGEDGEPVAGTPQILLGSGGEVSFIVAGMGGDVRKTAAFILRAEAGKENEGISFAECPSCAKSNERVRYAGSMFNFYLAPAAVIDSVDPALPGEAAAIIDASGLSDINLMQMTVRPEGDDLVARVFIDTPAEKGLIPLYGKTALTADDLKLVPADAKYFEIAKTDWVAMHGYIKGLLDAVIEIAPPGAADEVAGPVKKWLAANEIDLKADLCEALGDTVVVSDSPAVGVPLLGGLTIVAEVKDAPRVRKVIARCMAALADALKPKAEAEDLPIPLPGADTQPADPKFDFQPPTRKLFGFTNPQVQQTDHKGTTLYAINLLLAAPTIACTEKYLVITLNVQAAKQALDFLAGVGGKSVADDPARMAELTPLLDPAKGRPISLAWSQNRTALEDGYNLLVTLAQVGSAVAADNGFPFSSADLPNAEAFGRHIRPTVAVGRIVPEGLYAESRGSLPFAVPPTIVNVLGVLPGMAAGLVGRRSEAGAPMAFPDGPTAMPGVDPDVLESMPAVPTVQEPVAPAPTTLPAAEPEVIVIP